MLKSIYEGYIPCIVMAAVGFSAIGGSFLAWLSFVWIFGAVLTVALAAVRAHSASTETRPQAIGVMGNC